MSIDLRKINPTLWKNPKILKDLVKIEAPLPCIQLVASLRGGVPFSDITITLKQSGSFYQISGLKGNAKLISELISLFPDVTSLSLANNQLISLQPLVPSLKILPSLTSLDLRSNPIHNPGPLAELSQLTFLNIENTGIPNIGSQDLKVLMAREKQVKVENIKFLERMTGFVSGYSGSLEERETDILKETSPSALLELLNLYIKDHHASLHDLSLEDKDALICILERLGEDGNLWCSTLALGPQKLSIIPCDNLFNMFQGFHPRRRALEILFAIKFALPHGTIPNTLSFVDSIPSMQANCLTRLDVSNVCVSSQFLSSLNQFENLFHLSLTNIQLKNLNDFPKLGQLKVLNLKNNHITTLKGLHTESHDIKFPELNIFNLASNKICTDMGITYLLELDKLTYLNLNINELTQMPSLGNLVRLTFLNLSYNKIPGSQLNAYKNRENFTYTPQK